VWGVPEQPRLLPRRGRALVGRGALTRTEYDAVLIAIAQASKKDVSYTCRPTNIVAADSATPASHEGRQASQADPDIT